MEFEILSKIEQEGYEAFIVGGYVRDKLLNKQSFDIDICTNAKYEELVKIFPNLKYNNFFSSELKINYLHFDITTYRIDDNYDGRKPLTIKYTKSLIDDLKRRDFTINTILLDKNGNYIDYLNGIEDLKRKKIRSVSSLGDDYLRILRAIRFATILNFKIAKDTQKQIKKEFTNVSKLSIYRIRSELDKILISKNYKYGIKLLKKFKIDKVLKIKFKPFKHTSLMEIYSKIEIDSKYFTKKELKEINKFCK